MDIIFSITGGYALQNGLFSLRGRITYYTGTFPNDTIWGKTLNYIFIHSLFFIIPAFLLYWFIIRKRAKEGVFEDKSYFVLSLAVPVTLSSVVLRELRMWYSDSKPRNFNWYIIIRGYCVLCSILILTLLIEFCENKRSRIQKKLSEYEREKTKQQYKITEETLLRIKRKSHDLKRQIESLDYVNENRKKEYVQEIKDNIENYGSIVQTKSEPLNLVRMEKLLDCSKHSIQFTYIIDVDNLDFVESIDIYNLFGNALDNAIQASKKVKDKTKRRIYRRISKEKEVILIHIENYYDGDLIIRHDWPVSSKKDPDIHGIGLKSIKHIAEKYNGSFDYHFDNQIFQLNIRLLPTQNSNP